MLIRYREWDSDGITAHKGLHGPTEYVFLDENQGVCDVRNKAAIDYFLHHESHRYEIAYEHYGVRFGPDGLERESHPPLLLSSVEHSIGRPRKSRR